MLGYKLLWDSVARAPRHKSALRGPSFSDFGHAAGTGVRDPIELPMPDRAGRNDEPERSDSIV